MINALNESVHEKLLNEMSSKWQYDMFILHFRDHWNHLEKRLDYMNFKNSNDMRLFYTLTQSNCDFENIVLYWNDKFLKSEFGQKWKNTLLIKPLVDNDGIFCYLKNENYTFQWTNELEFVTKRSKSKATNRSLNNAIYQQQIESSRHANFKRPQASLKRINVTQRKMQLKAQRKNLAAKDWQ